MVLIIRSLAIVFFLVTVLWAGGMPIEFSRAAESYLSLDLSETSYENAMSTIPIIDYVPYYPDESKMNYEKPNLFISGVLQNSPNAYYNDQKLRDFADENGAIYVPTYYPSGPLESIVQLPFDALAVNAAAQSKATDRNGLKRDELNNREYGTIIGYSGGTTTVVTAMADQNVKADTLILISPVMGGSVMPLDTFDWKGEFEQKLQTILSRGTKIVIIQSPDDVLSIKDDVLDASQYQYKIPESVRSMSSWLNDIEVHNVELEKGGVDGHKEIFDSYAVKNIKNGEYIDPETEPKPRLPLKEDFLMSLGLPLLSPSDSGIIWLSDQSKDAPETSGDKTYFDKANDVWYVDAFSWSGDRSLHSKPAAPYRFISGERNTYGYNWIYLPYERTGLWYSQGYADWVTETLASMGMSGPTAGYGRLM